MTLGTLLTWLIIGILTGFAGHKVIGGSSPFGNIGDLILGGAGGVVGGYLSAYLIKPATLGGLISTYIAALVAALLLIWLSGKMKK